MKKVWYWVIGFVIIAVLLVTSIKLFLPKQASYASYKSYTELNEDKIECYENTLYTMVRYANITASELNVQNVRCLQVPAYAEREMNGTYFENDDRSKEPKTFYFNSISGGAAPSGADGYYEVCLIIGNETVVSKIETGRNLDYQSPARCTWQPELPKLFVS